MHQKQSWIYAGTISRNFIRYKTGNIPSIHEEYENISEKETTVHAEYMNEIDYKGKPVDVLKYWEEKKVKGKAVRTEFQ